MALARVLLLLVPLLLREAVEVVAMRPIAFQRVLIATSSASAAAAVVGRRTTGQANGWVPAPAAIGLRPARTRAPHSAID